MPTMSPTPSRTERPVTAASPPPGVIPEPARRFLAEPWLVLSTSGPRGALQASAIWLAERDGGIEFNVGVDSAKARNLRRRPDAALVVAGTAWPYRQAIIYGRAEEVDFDAEQAGAIAVRYMGEEQGEAMHRAMMRDERRTRFRLVPERVVWVDFSGDCREGGG
jgi:PPOX class probable F420-dependent enzyme